MSEELTIGEAVRIPVPQDGYLDALYEPPLPPTPEEIDKNGGKAPRRMSCLIFLHDFPTHDTYDQSELTSHISSLMSPHGFASLRFHFRGCGKSTGEESDFSLNRGLSDLRKAMDWLRNKHKFSQFILIAEGLSAQLALQAFMPNLVTAIVFLWPNIIPLASQLSFLKGAHQDHDTQKTGFLEKGGHKYSASLINEINILNIKPLLETITCPTLVQHGRDDKITPIGQIDILRDHMIRSRMELGLFEKGDHGLTDPGMQQAMLTNIEHFLKKIV